MMQCEQFEALLHPWLDGELDEANRRQLEEHTRQCAACAQRKQALEEFLEVCSDMGNEEVVPEAAAMAWRRAIRQEAVQGERMAHPNQRRRVKPVWRTWASVAAGIMLWIGGTVLVHNSPLGTGYQPVETAPRLFGEMRKSGALQNAAPEPATQPFVLFQAPEADMAQTGDVDEAQPYATDSPSAEEAPRAYAAMPEQEDAGAPMARTRIELDAGPKEDLEAPVDTELTQGNGWRGYLQDAGVFLLMCLPVVMLVVGITYSLRKRRRKK